MANIVAGIAGKNIHKVHDTSKPQGVRGRNSDNTCLGSVLGWQPVVSLEDGLSRTYEWISEQLRKEGRLLKVTTAAMRMGTVSE